MKKSIAILALVVASSTAFAVVAPPKGCVPVPSQPYCGMDLHSVMNLSGIVAAR